VLNKNTTTDATLWTTIQTAGICVTVPTHRGKETGKPKLPIPIVIPDNRLHEDITGKSTNLVVG